eukprot:6631819-Prorocentrum_lima.AAC.1
MCIRDSRKAVRGFEGWLQVYPKPASEPGSKKHKPNKEEGSSPYGIVQVLETRTKRCTGSPPVRCLLSGKERSPTLRPCRRASAVK